MAHTTIKNLEAVLLVMWVALAALLMAVAL